MDNHVEFDLIPVGFRQKSFYGKARIRMTSDETILHSYNTPVAMIAGGKFRRLWDGYSVTTMKHINSYRMIYGFNPINKSEWMNIPVD